MRKLLRRTLIVVLSIATVLMVYFGRNNAVAVVSRDLGADGKPRVTLLSSTHTIDRIYQSMQGPASQQTSIFLSDAGPRHVVWLTALDSQLVGADGKSEISREYFCHSNLTFTPGVKIDHTSRTPSTDERLFTLIPGRLSLSLPDGFAIPVWSDESLDYFTMSLNLNHHGDPVQVRFRTTIHFRDDTASSSSVA